MEITFDSNKSEKNRRDRNLPFERAALFEFPTAKIKPVRRHGELRLTALGLYEDKVHFLCFTTHSAGIRVISFRRASRKERREYDEFRKVLGHDRHGRLDG